MGVPVTFSIVLIAALFGAYDCNNMRSTLCNYVARSCGSNFMVILHGMESEPDVDQACALVSQMKQCLGDCLSALTSSPQQSALIKVLEFVCDPARRNEVREVAAASCFVDGSLERDFESDAQECANDMRENSRTAVSRGLARGITNVELIVCPLLADFMTCIDEKVEAICGENVVPFINQIFDVVLQEMLEDQLPSCFEQTHSVHSVMKRAVGYLKKLRK